jgi:hypothetical protein
MMLSQCFYVLICFNLSVWTRAPVIVLASAHILQELEYISMLDTFKGDEHIIFWRVLANLQGCFLGWLLVQITQVPRFLSEKPSFTPPWVIGGTWLVLHLAAESIRYWFRPFPSLDGAECTLIAQLLLLLWSHLPLHHAVLEAGYAHQKRFFCTWAATFAVLACASFCDIQNDRPELPAAGTALALVVMLAFWYVRVQRDEPVPKTSKAD